MRDTKVSYLLEQKRVLATAPLVGLVVMISLANQRFIGDGALEKRQSRAVASVAKAAGLDRVEIEWQQRVARSLASDEASPEKRDPASIGSRPDPFDQLRFGVLEGKYSFILAEADQRVREIHFVEANNDRPKYILEPSAFLHRYNGLFAVDFDNASYEGKSMEAGYMKETYTLFDKSKARVGSAEFHVDSDGRVLAILIK